MIRKAVALASLLALLVPAPAYAHTVGGAQGAEIELLLAAVAVFIIAWMMRSQPGATRWMRWTAAGVGLLLIIGAFALPRLRSAGSSAASLRVVAPAQGAVVDASRPLQLRVAVKNGAVAKSPSSRGAGHLHLYLDGKLQQMPYSTTMRVTMPPGDHSVIVEYVDAEHVSFNPPVRETIELTAK